MGSSILKQGVASRMCAAALAASCILAVQGCTIVHIRDDAGAVRVEKHFGVLKLDAGNATRAVVADTTVIGFGTDSLTTTLGFGRSRVALMPRECTLLIWSDNVSTVQAWKEHIPDLNLHCMINPSQGDTQK